MTIGQLYDVNNVVVGQAALLYGVKNTPLPDLGTVNFADPFDLSVFQTEPAPPYAWNPVGATDQGWKFTANKSTQATTVEEQSTPAGMAISSQAVTIEGAASEDVSAVMALAYNATLTTTAAAAGVPGTDELNPTDDVLDYAVTLITVGVSGKPRWIYAPVWTQLSNVETDFRRAVGKHMYPISLATICQPSAIRIINFTAPPTA